MDFTPIDLAAWPRRETFAYFSRMAPTGYFLTVQLDVTAMRRTLRQAGRKFFPAWVWLVTRDLICQPEFRLAEREGVLGCFGGLTPLYAAFHPDDRTFSLLWTDYDPDFPVFYRRYLDDQARYGGVHGLLGNGLPPEDAYTVSCLPWVSFDHFAVHSFTPPYYLPTVEAGRWREEGGRTLLPVSLTCHHAAADGWHVKCFLEALQADMDRFEAFLRDRSDPRR